MNCLTIKDIFFKLPYICILCSVLTFSQNKYITKSGEIRFEASVSSFEVVNATNKGVSAILNTENGEIAVLALVKGFRFKVALMEEHFNENYMESRQYPKATFKGVLQDFFIKDLIHSGMLETRVKGLLTIKGQTKEIVSRATLKKIGKRIALQAKFMVSPSDFDIKIPKIVQNKIAEVIKINVSLDLIKP